MEFAVGVRSELQDISGLPRLMLVWNVDSNRNLAAEVLLQPIAWRSVRVDSITGSCEIRRRGWPLKLFGHSVYGGTLANV